MTIDYNKLAFALACIVVSVLVCLGKVSPTVLAGLAAAGHLLPDQAKP